MMNDEKLTLAAATTIVDVALEKGRELQLLPLTVAVLDSGGHLVALKRADDSGIMRSDIAIGKAWGSLGMGTSSRTLRDRISDRPTFLNALAVVSQGRFIPVPGGVLIRNTNKKVVGAVGVSGDTSDRDEYCAIVAIAAAGFQSDPKEPNPKWNESRL